MLAEDQMAEAAEKLRRQGKKKTVRRGGLGWSRLERIGLGDVSG